MNKLSFVLVTIALVKVCHAQAPTIEEEGLNNESPLADAEPQKLLDDEVAALTGNPDAVEPQNADHVQPRPTERVTLAELSNFEPNMTMIEKVFCGNFYYRTYKQINDFLVDNVESPNTAPNMKVAVERLHAELAREGRFNTCQIRGLYQFTALASITPENKCTWESFKIIYNNDRATHGRTHQPRSQTGILTRIETVIRTYSLGHAIDCHFKYPEIYNALKKDLDPTTGPEVIKFMSKAVSLHFFDRHVYRNGGFTFFGIDGFFSPKKMFRKINSLDNQDTGILVYKALLEYSQGDPDSRYLRKVVNEKTAKMVVRHDKVLALLGKYLVQPCTQYIMLMGPHVYIPAAYDTHILETDERYPLNNVEFRDFLRGWVFYRICQLLVFKDAYPLATRISHIIQMSE